MPGIEISAIQYDPPLSCDSYQHGGHTAVEQIIAAFVVEFYTCLFCDLTSGKYNNFCVAVLREIWTKNTAVLRELLYLAFC
jgi:hypothetical protein